MEKGLKSEKSTMKVTIITKRNEAMRRDIAEKDLLKEKSSNTEIPNMKIQGTETTEVKKNTKT